MLVIHSRLMRQETSWFGIISKIDLSFRSRQAPADSLSRYSKPLMLTYVLLFVVSGIATLPEYGLNWDEGNGDVFIGERYFHYLISLDPAYLDFDKADLDIHQRPFNLYWSPYRDKPHEFPPLANTLSAMTMELFGYRLGWLDPVDAFHLTKVLLCGVLLWALYSFAAPRLGTLTAGMAVLMLSTYPRFWGDMHFNAEDIPETVFFALTIFAFYVWSEHPTWRRAGLVGILLGAALGSKGNALFIPPILVLGLFPLQPRWVSVTEHLRRYVGHYVLMIGTALLVHFITWPYLFADPLRVQEYYSHLFTEGYLSAPADWNWDPLIQTVTTMPEIDLILLIVGIAFAVLASINDKSRLLRLLLVWFAVPILRSSLPGSANFDGIRHFEEFVPAACLLASYGGSTLVNLSARITGRKTIAAVGLVLLLGLNVVAIEARYRSYEHLYYNSLVGGLKGAQQRNSDATDYWGVSYRQGMRWLNYNAERDAALHVAIAPWIVRLTAPIWLRSDITLIEEPAIKRKLEAGYPVYVMFITRSGWYNSIATFSIQKLQPVHQITVDGATIMVIYRLESVPPVVRAPIEARCGVPLLPKTDEFLPRESAVAAGRAAEVYMAEKTVDAYARALPTEHRKEPCDESSEASKYWFV